jgi:hypothetical protein
MAQKDFTFSLNPGGIKTNLQQHMPEEQRAGMYRLMELGGKSPEQGDCYHRLGRYAESA